MLTTLCSALLRHAMPCSTMHRVPSSASRPWKAEATTTTTTTITQSRNHDDDHDDDDNDDDEQQQQEEDGRGAAGEAGRSGRAHAPPTEPAPAAGRAAGRPVQHPVQHPAGRDWGPSHLAIGSSEPGVTRTSQAKRPGRPLARQLGAQSFEDASGETGRTTSRAAAQSSDLGGCLRRNTQSRTTQKRE